MLHRSDDVCDHMVALVNSEFVKHGLEPLYKRENLMNWFKHMSYTMSLGDSGLKETSAETDQQSHQANCDSDDSLDAELEIEEEAEMQRGVDTFLLPSLREVATHEPVAGVDVATRNALLSKYNALLAPARVANMSMPAKRKANLMRKYESIERVTASTAG